VIEFADRLGMPIELRKDGEQKETGSKKAGVPSPG